MSVQLLNIVIIGGGFAGSTLLKALQSDLPDGYHLILVSEESYTTFSPMLPETVGASIFPEQVVAPLREVLDVRAGHQFVMGLVTRVDRTAKTIYCNTLAGEVALVYSHLVIALGNRARLDFMPGMSEYSLPLKTVGDALEIRNTVLRRLAQTELTENIDERRALTHFVVIGGGFSGVEVAGELIDCLVSIQRYYPRVDVSNIKVTVLQNIERLLPELPPALGEAACQSLRKRGVVIHFGASATEIMAHGVRFLRGNVEDECLARTVICTIGSQPNALLANLGLLLERGRLAVQPDMSVSDSDGIWALGDCASVPNAMDNNISPTTAQFAVHQAKHLAINLRCFIAKKPTQPFSYRAKGTMAAIGHMKGVAQVFGISISGLPAWLIWRAYYLSQMPTFGRKLRIFVEWSWGMFFPADITHLRFTRSKDQKEK